MILQLEKLLEKWRKNKSIIRNDMTVANSTGDHHLYTELSACEDILDECIADLENTIDRYK